MTTLNRDAAEAALAAGVEAATDVTGFGLLGHLHRMLRASGVSAGSSTPPGCRSCPGRPSWPGPGSSPAAPATTRPTCATTSSWSRACPRWWPPCSHDAQTSGGLLLAVAPERLGGLVADLRGRGIEPAVIGRVLDGPPGRIGVRRLPSG